MLKNIRQIIIDLSKLKPKQLDELVHTEHNRVFGSYDCISCARCCTSLGPLLTNRDIVRVSDLLKMKPGGFTQKYLRIDEDGDYVFKQMPCPFLEADHKCRIYEHRPAACREYPHTDRKNFYQILPLTEKNAATCPAVVEILESVNKKIV